MEILTVGTKVTYKRTDRGITRTFVGTIIEVTPNQPFSIVAYTVLNDASGLTRIVLPQYIVS